MSDEGPKSEEGGVDPFRPSWPPSPRTQIILIAVGLGLLNLLLLVIWGIALYMRH
jgi:hypothetical protein